MRNVIHHIRVQLKNLRSNAGPGFFKESLKQYTTIGLLLPMLFFTNCGETEKLENLQVKDYKPEFAAPLIDSRLTVNDIKKETETGELEVIENEDNYLSFIYRDTVISSEAPSFLKLSNTGFNYVIDLPASNPPGGDTIRKTYDEENTLDFKDIGGLKEIKMKSGELTINVSSDYEHDVNLELTMPSLLKNGTVVSKTIELNYQGSTPVTKQVTVDLNNSLLDLESQDTCCNTFSYNIDFTLISSGNSIQSSDELNMNFSLGSLGYEYIKGRFNEFDIPVQDGDVVMNIFDDDIITDIHFEEPRLVTTLDNSFGLPSDMYVEELYAEDNETGQQESISNSVFNDTLDLNYPSVIGNSQDTSFELNKDNSNLQDILQPGPKTIHFSAHMGGGGSSTHDNFITDESKVKVYGKMVLPLFGRIKVYKLGDTLEAPDFPSQEEVKRIIIKTRADNSMPVSIKVQLYMLDKQKNIIDSLFHSSRLVVKTANTDSKGEVTSNTSKVKEVEVSKKRYRKWKNANRVALIGTLVTPDNSTKNVKIYPEQALRFRLSSRVKTNLN